MTENVGDDQLLNLSSKCSSTNGDNGAANEHSPGMFEGPEKTLEVTFRPGIGPPEGLRTFSREQLDFLCTKAKCSIVHQISNNYMDAYILSESSLFVYKHRYIMKTCGTTTLLRCLASLLQFADEIGMELTWVGYSRKNLLFPSAQLWPHSNFGEELRYITTHEKLQNRLRGTGHILGPITGDHWFVYVADHSETSPFLKRVPSSVPTIPSKERTINMMMFDMATEVGEIFYLKNTPTSYEMTRKSGIHHLCPGAIIDDTSFNPCGYSMNAILHDAYSTIHITPEPECSYASFETNTCLDNYAPMIRNVLSVFKPKRFVLTMFGDEAAVASLKSQPTDLTSILLPGFGVFVRTSVSSTKVDIELCCTMACFTVDSMRTSSSCQALMIDETLAPLSTSIGESNSAKDRSYSWC